MELFADVVNGWKPLSFSPKSFILDVSQGSEYTSGSWHQNLYKKKYINWDLKGELIQHHKIIGK